MSTTTGRTDRTAVLSARDILTSIGEVVYEWSIGDDVLRWGSNALDVLQVPSFDAIGTGRRFSGLLDADNLATRYDAVMSTPNTDDGHGVPYSVQYCFMPRGRAGGVKLWLEDTGRWFGDSRGKPTRAHGVIRIINERHEREQRLAYLSRFDELTGQLNRPHFMEAMNEAIETARKMRTSLAVMLCSIDNLGVINESYGFDVADQVIALVAQRLKSRLRGGDAIGRYSGNKIGLVVLNCSEGEMATAAERFVDATRDEIVATDQGPVSATISIGGVLAPRFARDAAEAIARAQEALDQVRNGRRSIFNAYQPSPERVSERRRNLALADEIVRSLNDRRIRLAYQPIVRATDRSIAFHECLVRLESTTGQIASAAHIVPVAEKLGLIRLLDVRVWELAARDLFECTDARVSINVSTRTTADPAWLRNMAAMLNAYPGVAERLVVEITESAAIHDVAETRRLVETLQGCGARVAIDDFGAGFTSFRALKSLGVDLIKIDGAFVENALTTPTDKAFVMALADLAKSLGAETVAEWVGDEETAVELGNWGIDYLQGCHTGSAFIERPWVTTTTLDEATQRRLAMR